MNLPRKVVRQIERGEKTEHRLPATASKPKVGDSLIVQNRRDHEDEAKALPQVRVRVLDVPLETVGETGLQGAKAEGHKTLAAFASDWMRRYDTQWPPTTEALCPECAGHKHYVDHAGETVQCDYCDEVGTLEVEDRECLADTELIIARFQRRHAHHLVHVIRFELDADVVRYLNQRSYLPPTTNPTEALDPEAPLLGAPRPDWRTRAETRRLEALKDTAGARLAGLDRLAAELEAEAELLALATETDVARDMFVIKARLERIRQRIENRRAA